MTFESKNGIIEKAFKILKNYYFGSEGYKNIKKENLEELMEKIAEDDNITPLKDYFEELFKYEQITNAQVKEIITLLESEKVYFWCYYDILDPLRNIDLAKMLSLMVSDYWFCLIEKG